MTCSIEGCDKPKAKRGWCSNHYYRWRVHGDVNYKPKWEWARGRVCLHCGSAVPEGAKTRRYCSPRCEGQYAAHKGNRVTLLHCGKCGGGIDMSERVTPTGRARRIDVKLCTHCRSRRGKHAMTPRELAARDGADCTICGAAVDMSLKAPDRMRASVDHMVPRACGGSDDPENLRLAHLRCNQIKSDREGFSLVMP